MKKIRKIRILDLWSTTTTTTAAAAAAATTTTICLSSLINQREDEYV